MRGSREVIALKLMGSAGEEEGFVLAIKMRSEVRSICEKDGKIEELEVWEGEGVEDGSLSRAFLTLLEK